MYFQRQDYFKVLFKRCFYFKTVMIIQYQTIEIIKPDKKDLLTPVTKINLYTIIQIRIIFPISSQTNK